MARYRHLPTVVDAEEWTGDWEALQSWLEVMGLLPESMGHAPPVSRNDDDSLYIATFEGVLQAHLGCTVISSTIGGLYFNRPGVFDLSYELAS